MIIIYFTYYIIFINTSIFKNLIKWCNKRFNNNPEIEATDILLQERMPINMIITKEKKEKISNLNENLGSGYIQRNVNERNAFTKDIHVLSNGNYKITINEDGEGKSEYNGLLINNYKETSELKQGIFFYVKNIKNRKVIRPEENANVLFSPEQVQYSKQDGNLKFDLKITIDPDKAVEIRRLEIENMGKASEILEVISEFEPILAGQMQEYAHPAFSKLFLKIAEQDEIIILKRKDILGAMLYTESEQIGDFEYEINKEKYYGRGIKEIPTQIEEGKHFSNDNKIVVDKIVALKRTIKVSAGEKVSISLCLNVSEDQNEILENLEELKSEEEIKRTFEFAKLRNEEELKYLQIKQNSLLNYQNLLKYVIQPNYLKVNRFSMQYRINDLWKYGISGDLPIIFVKIKAIEDMYVIEELIECFEYYRAKNIQIDLVIFNEEENVYEKYVRGNIEEIIANRQLQFLINCNGGIFLIDKNNSLIEDIESISFKSRVIIDASRGGIDNYLREHEEKLKELNVNHVFKKIENMPQVVLENPEEEQKLEFYNGFGGFSKDGKEYICNLNNENTLPSVWSNILANQFFGSVVTENLGGYTWNKNSRLNRLTSWNNNSLVDLPSEIFYIKDEDENYTWTLNHNVNPNSGKYIVTHGFGYTKLVNNIDNLEQELEIFVPEKDPLKVNKFKIKNTLSKKRTLKIVYYIKSVLGEDEIKTNGNIAISKTGNVILARNVLAEEEFKDKIMYISSNLKINSYTGEKSNFFKGGSIKFPNALFEKLNSENGIAKNSCIGLEFEITLNPLEEKEFAIIMGEESNEEQIQKQMEYYTDIKNVEIELENIKGKWEDILSTLNIKTPSKELDFMVNGWLPYQGISSRIFGKTGYYQSGGAYGFRDQLQDCMGLKYIDKNFLKNQIINCASHQFLEGDVLHWWHEETKKGIRTRITDDLLWLVYAVLEYINFSGEYEILDEEVEYLKGEILSEEENERYSVFYKGDIKENIFEHCVRSINRTIDAGIDKFPKIGTGDWNDGFDKLGSKGKGESVWLGFFLYDILSKFIPICKMRKRNELVIQYEEVKEKLKKNLNINGWDGRWYKRAITDDGEIIGGMDSKECRIDSLTQSWAVISGAGDNDKKFIAIESAENYLVDRENKIIKLFDPPFENWNIDPGYIKDYLPGIRENAGQYTHAAVWLVIAEAMLGFGEKAVEFAEMICPINHTKTKEDCKIYKLEPYIIAADVYSAKGLEGRGGWNWYTGAANWYYCAIVEYILGFKIKNNYIEFEPCIPKSWKDYEIKYKYKTSIYNIKVKNKNRKKYRSRKSFSKWYGK